MTTTHLPQHHRATPVETLSRHIVIDALRGFALFGVCMANYPEFSLYTFLPAEVRDNMASAGVDYIVRWLQLVFIDGKFYTLFSLLFGLGFSIILSNAQKRGADGMRIFYRRMIILALIGLAHLLLLWSGDILMLYALLGMLLPLVYKLRDKHLLMLAGALLLLPVLIDGLTSFTGHPLAEALLQLQWRLCHQFGITEENFATWLRDADGYGEVSAFLMQGAFERMWEFVEGNRYFKVMGLFILGFYIGRNRIYADAPKHQSMLATTGRIGLMVGLPLSVAYAWSAISGRPLGAAVHTLLYTLSVYPMGLGYAALFLLQYRKRPQMWFWKALAAPGRMALTCYLSQSIIGILLFYGVGLGMGTSLGLTSVECIALGVFLLQASLCSLWLKRCQYGPFEWVWRMLTYGSILPIRKKK